MPVVSDETMEHISNIQKALQLFELSGAMFTKKDFDLWEAWDLIHSLNKMGYSLLKTDNLRDYFTAKDFSENNGMELINHHFE